MNVVLRGLLAYLRAAALLGMLALGGASVALAGGGPRAHASGYLVTLNLQGGYANKTLRACGISHHYTYYRARRRVPFNGSVRPAPAKPWRVKVKFKKCVRGRFVTVEQVHVAGSSRGHFDGSARSPGRGLYFARAYYYGTQPAARSDKQYFRIR